MHPADVALVRFPFTTLDATKKRPALVLSHTALGSHVGLWTVAMITSRVEGLRFQGDVLLQDWEQCRLIHPSLVRLSKLATVETDLLEKHLGTLSPRDLKEIKRALRVLYRFWL